MDKIGFNGKWLDAGTPVASADNRGLRYGDGVFETMRLENGRIPLASLHFDRLFSALDTLGFEPGPHFTREKLEKEILELATKNQHTQLARIRLMVFRGDGGLYEPGPLHTNYLMQSWALNESYQELNTNGLMLDIFPDARKSTDPFSNLKSANYLPYIMAALYARKHRLNDCLLLNTDERITDSTIANLFISIEGKFITPPLSEGCVAGVMRRYLLEKMPDWGFAVEEAPISVADLEKADHAFLTNAVSGIRWIASIGKKKFTVGRLGELYKWWQEKT